MPKWNIVISKYSIIDPKHFYVKLLNHKIGWKRYDLKSLRFHDAFPFVSFFPEVSDLLCIQIARYFPFLKESWSYHLGICGERKYCQ